MSSLVFKGDRRSHVLAQLARLPNATRGTSKTTMLCPFHPEKTPSCVVYHSASDNNPGGFKCFGCGETGGWNKLAERLNLEPFGRTKPKEHFASPLSLSSSFDADIDDEDILFIKEPQRNIKKLPKNKLWRGISTNLLRKIGAYTAEFYVKSSDDPDGYWTNRRLYLPVLVKGELQGYIKARLKKHPKFASYINASGPWTRKVGLFPFDYSISLMNKLDSDTIVLVEGQRDALRLISMGIPAMCILGTQSWSDAKARMLETAGVHRIVLFMDGDCAGRSATKKIEPTIKHMFNVQALKLWKMKGSPWMNFKDEPEPSKAAKEAGVDLWDPGNCPERILLKIKQKFFDSGETK